MRIPKFFMLIILAVQALSCENLEYDGKSYIIQGLSDKKGLKKIHRFIKKCASINSLKESLEREFDSVCISDSNNSTVISVKKPACKVDVNITSHKIKSLLEKSLMRLNLIDKDKNQRMLIVKSVLEGHNIYKYKILEQLIQKNDEYEIVINIEHHGEAKRRLVVNKSSSIKPSMLHECMPTLPSFMGWQPDYNNHPLIAFNILNELKSLGYLAAQVKINGEIFNRKMNTIDLQIHIEEGPKCIMCAQVDVDKRLPLLVRHEIPRLPSVLFFQKPNPFTQKAVNHIAREVCEYLNQRNIKYCTISVQNPRVDKNKDPKADREYRLIFKVSIDEEAQYVRVKEKFPCLAINIDNTMQDLSTLSGDLVSNRYIELSANELSDPISEKITLKDDQLIYENDLPSPIALEKSGYMYFIQNLFNLRLQNLFMDKSQLDFDLNPYQIIDQMRFTFQPFANLDSFMNYLKLSNIPFKDLRTSINYQKQTSPLHKIDLSAFMQKTKTDILSNFFENQMFTVDSNSVVFIPYLFLVFLFGKDQTLNSLPSADIKGVRFKSNLNNTDILNGFKYTFAQSVYAGRESYSNYKESYYVDNNEPINSNTFTITHELDLARNKPYDEGFDWKTKCTNELIFLKPKNYQHSNQLEFFDKFKAEVDLKKKWSNSEFRLNIRGGIKIKPMTFFCDSIGTPFHNFKASDVSQEHYYRIHSDDSKGDFFYHSYMEYKIYRYSFGLGFSNLFSNKASIFKINPFFSIGFRFSPRLGIKINKTLSSDNSEVIIKNLIFTA